MEETGQPGGATPANGGDEARDQADRPWAGGGWPASEAAWSQAPAGSGSPEDPGEPAWNQPGQTFASEGWAEASARYADVMSSLSSNLSAASDPRQASNGASRREWPPGGQRHGEPPRSEDHHSGAPVGDAPVAARRRADRRAEENPHGAGPASGFEGEPAEPSGGGPAVPSQRSGTVDDSRSDGPQERRSGRGEPPWAARTGRGDHVHDESGPTVSPPGPPPGWRPEPPRDREPAPAAAPPPDPIRSAPPYDEWHGPGAYPVADTPEEPGREMPDHSNPSPGGRGRPDWSPGWAQPWESSVPGPAEHGIDSSGQLGPAHPTHSPQRSGPARQVSDGWHGLTDHPGSRTAAPDPRVPASVPADPLTESADPSADSSDFARPSVPDALPQRVPAEPDVPTVPEPSTVEPPAETPELARIATHLRRDDDPSPLSHERPDGFDVQAILAAVRGVDGVKDAALRKTPEGAHRLRLDLADGADAAEVSRQVARLLQERMGLAAAPQNLPGDSGGEAEQRPPRRHRQSAYRGRAGVAEPTPGERGGAAVAGSHQFGGYRGRAGAAPGPHSGERIRMPETTSRPLRAGERPAPRLILDHVQVSTFGLDATVEVRLASGSQQAIGLATGPAVDGYVLRLCAAAAASAVDELLRVAGPTGEGRCIVEHAAIVPFGNCDVAVVVVLLVCDGWAEQLAGSALVSGDPRQAVVRATLAAVNRRLTALLS
ncbi:MAG TPA: hypothetical protein VFX61_12220 [Micromonosporaceae bacterium]|nr:hypothetical protein [Micromonosporaceae bacterium]